MAWHLEAHAGVRAVVNLVPVLLDQIEDYADQFATRGFRDPLLRLLARDPSTPLTDAERQLAVDRCFHANHDKMMKPFAAYTRLHALFTTLEGNEAEPRLPWLSDQYYYDLVTWYHLVWTGETVRRAHAAIPELMTRGAGFSHADRLAVMQMYGEVIRDIVPRYARLAADGRIEISTTPHDHPLGPLLIDFAAARDARPDSPLPESPAYPGGAERLAEHAALAFATPRAALRRTAARRVARRRCGVRRGAAGARRCGRRMGGDGRGRADEHAAPRGASARTPHRVPVSSVSRRRGHAGRVLPRRSAVRPHRVRIRQVAFARCRGELRRRARAHRRGRLAGRDAARVGDPRRRELLGVLSLQRLLLSRGAVQPRSRRIPPSPCAPSRRCSTVPRPTSVRSRVSRICRRSSRAAGCTATSRPGSARARRTAPGTCSSRPSAGTIRSSGADGCRRAAVDVARRQLAVCEASDWFWWLGDYNPADAVASFERVYRANLAGLYRLLGLETPAALSESLGHGSGKPEIGGAMRRAS